MTGNGATNIQPNNQPAAPAVVTHTTMLASPTVLPHGYTMAAPPPVNSYPPLTGAWIPHAAVGGSAGPYIIPHPMTTVSVLLLLLVCLSARHTAHVIRTVVPCGKCAYCIVKGIRRNQVYLSWTVETRWKTFAKTVHTYRNMCAHTVGRLKGDCL